MDRDDILLIALEMLEENGLDYWVVDFDQSRRRGGACNYSEEKIVFSEFLLSRADTETVMDTIRHEVAHALAGPRAKHGPVWKEYGRMLGMKDPSYRMLNPVKVALADYLWVGTCPHCDWQVGRHRLSQRTRHSYCPRCYDAYGEDAIETLSWMKSVEMFAAA